MSRIKSTQMQILQRLLRKGGSTTYGQKMNFNEIQSYRSFTGRLPITDYGMIEEQVELLKFGKENILWPGTIRHFAISSGTSGVGKHLPLSHERLNSDRRFMRKVILSYFRQRPNIFRLLGKHLSLPGTVQQIDGVMMGEISGFTARNAPRWLRWLQVSDPRELTRINFRDKFQRVLEQALTSDIRVITAVPSWVLTLFQEALESTGEKQIADIWPNLQLMVCGGVKLSNYRSSLHSLIGKDKIDYIETYGASEGYFAFSDNLERDDMRLVFDNGIFFEFIDNPLPRRDSLAIQQTVPLWKVEKGVPYALVVTTNAGLWRYGLNDIVEFTETSPPRIRVLGRLSEMLDDYGEALHVYEARKALSYSAEKLNLEPGPFSIGALLPHEKTVPRHIWFIQSDDLIHRDALDRLAGKIDSKLREINRHYNIRRESEALGEPKVYTVTQSRINAWLENTGRHTAQGKLPSILDKKEDIDFLKS